MLKIGSLPIGMEYVSGPFSPNIAFSLLLLKVLPFKGFLPGLRSMSVLLDHAVYCGSRIDDHLALLSSEIDCTVKSDYKNAFNLFHLAGNQRLRALIASFYKLL